MIAAIRLRAMADWMSLTARKISRVLGSDSSSSNIYWPGFSKRIPRLPAAAAMGQPELGLGVAWWYLRAALMAEKAPWAEPGR